MFDEQRGTKRHKRPVGSITNHSESNYKRSAVSITNHNESHRQGINLCSTFTVQHPNQIRQNPDRVNISQPREIAYFSKFKDNEVRFDRSNLSRYRVPPIGADLLEGLNSYIPKDESNPDIHPAPLQPILSAMEHFRTNITKLPQFVTYRNNLNKILGTPYNTSNSWTMGIEKRNGIVYLDVRRTLDDLQCNQNPHPNQVRACYSGRRFELYATEPQDTGDKAARENTCRVNEDEEYCGMFALTLGNKRLVVAAEIDCYNRVDAQQANYQYVELKTAKTLLTSKDRYAFERFKLLSFWIQSYIVGTPTIICGFRNNDFQIQKLQTFQTNEIPSYCHKHWEPRVCTTFASLLLDWIYANVKEGQVYSLAYNPRQHLVELAESNDSFLPVQWTFNI